MPLADPVQRKRYERRYKADHREETNQAARDRYPLERAAILLKNRRWAAANPVKVRARSLRDFHLTVEQYEAMLAKQGGVCAICQKPETRTVNGKVSALAVDHDRTCCDKRGESCGKCVRGLLCYRCNTAIGLLFDDLTILEQAMFYILRGSIRI
jgi:hypothetical protein